jgi:hypothetical protein
MTSLEKNLHNREHLLARLRAEIVGPDPAGKPVALSDRQAMSWDDFRTPRKQLNNEEIVWQDPPTKRFGAGILFPQHADDLLVEAAIESGGVLTPESTDLPVDGVQENTLPSWDDKSINFDIGEDSDEEGVTLANSFRPSALGLSFLADFAQESQGISIELISIGRIASDRTIEGPCGNYRPLVLMVGGANGKQESARKVWLREPLVDINGKVPKNEIETLDILSSVKPIRISIAGATGLELVIVARKWRGAPSPNHRLITISVINTRVATRENLEMSCLFQAGLRVTGLSGVSWIDAYPEYIDSEFTDLAPLADENVNKVLYRNNRTFAIGHGCGADWIDGRPEKVSAVWSDVLPVFETPSTSAELVVIEANGSRRNLRASMRLLAGLAKNEDGLGDADRLLAEYLQWIDNLTSAVITVPAKDRPTATALIERCRGCANRIASGLDLLRSTGAVADKARTAFRLANHAMLISQLRAHQKLRTPARDASSRITWDVSIQAIDPTVPSETHGYWRPFQIAFLLMSLRGIVEDTHIERSTVDLIWFPTGGGKTEAYLGLTAFTVFFNALSNAGTTGVDVLMRYTLRLLTAQQFQRAATLFCAMEFLRIQDPKSLGNRPFRIGLWVGRSATPNKRIDALKQLAELQKDPDAENPYILLRCPWCASKFGPHESFGGTNKTGYAGFGRARKNSRGEVLGYSKERVGTTDTVVFRCSDGACDFGGIPERGAPSLPIVVIDEDLLESPPNLLIGTVDKFAMLAWNPAARSLFGLGPDGKHQGAPPTLIIQDELHLISGPLGSMVGAYETVIETLCMDPLGGMILPKIVASTATISRAEEQVKGLYARKDVTLFPPSGLDAADSFFAREALDENGKPKPGRMYAGVLAPGHGSVQTSEARIFATLMQYAALLDGGPEEIDPWWTLLVFFNSLRELGGALTLFSADTREYFQVLTNRHGVDRTKIRKLFNVEELTSRIRGDHIPRLLERLEVPMRDYASNTETEHGPNAIDACLASSIIEVGVDIQRLSLMAIVGQPKTTSQYIQVSSRVGRASNKPGLVVVIYGQTKPRDRSHYEKFRPYHQKLYAQVEPTSVTPFSPPAVDRALHGLVVAMVRQLGDITNVAQSPDPFPLTVGAPLRIRIEEVIRDRVRAVASDEEKTVMDKLKWRLDQWQAWRPSSYGDFRQAPEDAPLMHPGGTAERPEWRGRSWSTMSSLRNVDASCEADITDAYIPVPGAPT